MRLGSGLRAPGLLLVSVLGGRSFDWHGLWGYLRGLGARRFLPEQCEHED
jgi:hypothetical protein